MNSLNPAIVIPVFSRVGSLSRLLESIDNAYYHATPVVIISIEGGANADVVKVARNYIERHANALIIERKSRLGLRNHILACGDLCEQYGSVIILEDDLWVDKYFYLFAIQALSAYEKNNSIAGIALYPPHYNEFADLPFVPIQNGYGTYPMQTPCSWGQAWTTSQWNAFRAWYATADSNTVGDNTGLPEILRQWPESSWKKYFAAYLVETNRYFIYPYHAATTNCSDAGGHHNNELTARYQVATASQSRPLPNYRLCPADYFVVAYDAYMEQCGSMLTDAIGLSPETVEMDLYGIKPLDLLRSKKYSVTIKAVRNPIRLFPLQRRPIDNNLWESVNDQKLGVLKLVLSDDVLSKKHDHDLHEYEYHGNLNFQMLRLVRRVIQQLPPILAKRYLGLKWAKLLY